MHRRDWLVLASAALLPSCAARTDGPGPDFDISRIKIAVSRGGGDGHGIWKNGRLAEGFAVSNRLPSLSITKSLASLAVVRAIGDGWLVADRPLVNLVPEWRSDSAKSRVTVRMLVNQTAGFVSGVAPLYRGRIPDKGRVAISLPLVDPPGERFRYGPASSEVLAEILRRGLAARGSSTEQSVREIMNRIGISSPGWREDAGERIYLSTGAEFSVDDLGRLGQTVASLARGKNAAGLDAAIFRDLAAPRLANPMFSAGIWWNRNATLPGAFAIEPERELDDVRPPSFWRRACLGPELDPGWLAMVGSGGKRVYALPDEEIVIARLGRSRGWNDGAFLRSLSA